VGVMEDFLLGSAALLLGYAIGSISFPRIVARLVSPETVLEDAPAPVEGTDEKLEMSGVSATSVRIKLGSKFGCLSSLLDMVKVAVPVAVFQILFPESPANFLAATGGILGHNWPIYYRFHGGYGHSAIYGGTLVIDWTAVPVNFVGTSIFYFATRHVHIALFGGVLLLLPWFWYRQHGIFALIYAGVCSVAYFIRLLPDLRSYQAIERRKTATSTDESNGVGEAADSSRSNV